MGTTFKQQLEHIDLSLISQGSLGADIGSSVGLVDVVSRHLGLKTQAAKEFVRISLANALLMDAKQLDYGPDNIADFREFGVVVRMNDKMKRLKHLYGKGRQKRANNEPVVDSFRDLSNYGIIALMCILDRWPTSE